MLSHIHQIHKEAHKDRYRKVYCDQNFYIRNLNLFLMWKTKFQNLSNVEKVQAWVVALSCLRRPNDWYGGKRQKTFLPETYPFQHTLSIFELFKDTPVKIPPKINAGTNLIDFINVCKIKAFPESCNRSLCFISNQKYPLIITEKNPAPYELLQIQISGQRVISLNEDCESWLVNNYSGRDFLGFIMHDLIHADHFFRDPKHRDGQLGFFKFIQNILTDENLNQLLFRESFKNGFDYIISDMNSHPVHLIQTLHALLYSVAKDDMWAHKCWENWGLKSQLSLKELEAVLSINSTKFNTSFAETIEILCIRLGKQI